MGPLMVLGKDLSALIILLFIAEHPAEAVLVLGDAKICEHAGFVLSAGFTVRP